MRLFFAASVILFSTSAHASFELMLMYDDNMDAVRRFDPVNRVLLGSFGDGMLGYYGNANLMTLNPLQPGTVSLMDLTGHVRTFDYNSGILVGSVNTGTGPFSSVSPTAFRFTNTGNILRATGASAAPQVFNPLTGALISTFQTFAGYSTIDVAPLADGRFVTLERQFSSGTYYFSLFVRNSSGGLLSNTGQYISDTTAGKQRHITLEGNRIFASGLDGLPSVYQTSLSGNSLSAPVSLGGTASSGVELSNVTFGHQGSGYFVNESSTGALSMYHLDANAGFYAPRYTLPFTGSITSVAMINAPEPGSLAALGLGTFWLARRRKLRSK